MTEQQKNMKKYTNAVERRLNLPREVRARVMSDFISAIGARRESGMTDEEIYAELGSPRQAAEALNEQMQEFAYRKSPWRYLFAACAAWGGADLLSQILGKLAIHSLLSTDSASVGIIGGADGPTAIFLTTTVEPWYYDAAMAAMLIVGIWGFFRLGKCRQKKGCA